MGAEALAAQQNCFFNLYFNKMKQKLTGNASLLYILSGFEKIK